MSGYFVKNPGTDLDLAFDWSVGFLESGETIDTDQGWTVHPDEPGSNGITVLSSASNSTTTSVILEGGRPGDAYLVSSSILTTAGRDIRRAMTVRVANV